MENSYPVIYRFEHGGEGLGLLRKFATAFTSARYQRYDISLQIQERSVVDGHSIDIFTCNFAKLIATGSDTHADHDYPRNYAREILTMNPHYTEDKKLCGRVLAQLGTAPEFNGTNR